LEKLPQQGETVTTHSRIAAHKELELGSHRTGAREEESSHGSHSSHRKKGERRDSIWRDEPERLGLKELDHLGSIMMDDGCCTQSYGLIQVDSSEL
jgi:hypothetical protein